MCNPSLHNIFRQRVMHDCVSILDSMAKSTSCFYNFGMVHPYIYHLTDFCTCNNSALKHLSKNNAFKQQSSIHFMSYICTNLWYFLLL